MKTIVITGAAGGIGLATSRRFLAHGWNVAMADLNASDTVDELVKQYGNQVSFNKFDVTDAAAVNHFRDDVVAKFGQIDVIYNNAGIFIPGELQEMTENQWDQLMAVNVKSIYLMVSAFVPAMIKRKQGVIINTSSVSGLLGDYGSALYNASKGAVTNLTRALALDYGKYGIRVNAVNPGPTNTPMLAQSAQVYIDAAPLKRLGEPEDIANAVYFLANDTAASITGVNLPVTNGYGTWTGQPQQDANK